MAPHDVLSAQQLGKFRRRLGVADHPPSHSLMGLARAAHSTYVRAIRPAAPPSIAAINRGSVTPDVSLALEPRLIFIDAARDVHRQDQFQVDRDGVGNGLNSDDVTRANGIATARSCREIPRLGLCPNMTSQDYQGALRIPTDTQKAD